MTVREVLLIQDLDISIPRFQHFHLYVKSTVNMLLPFYFHVIIDIAYTAIAVSNYRKPEKGYSFSANLVYIYIHANHRELMEYYKTALQRN